jgi:hypothetical protein
LTSTTTVAGASPGVRVDDPALQPTSMSVARTMERPRGLAIIDLDQFHEFGRLRINDGQPAVGFHTTSTRH